MSLDQVDYFVFHQANRMINETIRNRAARHTLPPTHRTP
jgi:3-oxoacyl-[acyl-carrier-protein] synthase III